MTFCGGACQSFYSAVHLLGPQAGRIRRHGYARLPRQRTTDLRVVGMRLECCFRQWWMQRYDLHHWGIKRRITMYCIPLCFVRDNYGELRMLSLKDWAHLKYCLFLTPVTVVMWDFLILQHVVGIEVERGSKLNGEILIFSS